VLKNVVLEPMESEAGEFTVLFWKVEQGDSVSEGDELLVVESGEEKTALTVLAPCAGVLVEISEGEDSKVAPGEVLGRIETA